MPVRQGNSHSGTAPFNVYEAKDGYVSMCVVTAENWRSLLVALNREELANDPRFVHLTARLEHRQEVKRPILHGDIHPLRPFLA